MNINEAKAVQRAPFYYTDKVQHRIVFAMDPFSSAALVWSMQEYVIPWCRENCTGAFRIYAGQSILFDDDGDATLVLLRFR